MKANTLKIGATATAAIAGIAVDQLLRKRSSSRGQQSVGDGLRETVENLPDVGSDVLDDLKKGVSSALGRTDNGEGDSDGDGGERRSLDDLAARRRERQERRQQRRSAQ